MKDINRISSMLATIKEITYNLHKDCDMNDDASDQDRENKFDSIVEQLGHAHYYLSDAMEMMCE